MTRGVLHLVSLGPGALDLIPPLAERALHESEVVIGYELYLKPIFAWIAGKEIHSPPLTQERERAQLAIDFACAGRVVSLVSSGDIGVYAMAALAFELMENDDAFEVHVIPGITAATSCAALLGSPLSHDFATLSLSDLLCPWEWIETRARHLAEADFVTVLYNVQSRARQESVYRVLELMLAHKAPETWCGVVRNAFREEASAEICTLAELANRRFDMLTTVIIGNHFTRKKGRFLFTPRGYGGWSETENRDAPASPNENPIWIFSGTSDGNALAREVAARGHGVVVSVASEYGKGVALAHLPGIAVRAGRMGMEARRRELRASGARGILDATHPFAEEISRQLIALSGELSIPYLRYERPRGDVENHIGAVRCETVAQAADQAVKRGRRIFLATGTKNLREFLTAKNAGEREWFARVTPDPEHIRAALSAGISRERLCAMQGPFSQSFNEALWRDWQIDCVVTKDSGDAGGFRAKADATRMLGIPLIIIERPRIEYPCVANDFAGALDWCVQAAAATSFPKT